MMTKNIIFAAALLTVIGCSPKMESETTLPFFKYNPDAVQLGIIKQEATHCPICGMNRAWVYSGPFYSVQDVEGICPWCISDGSAAKKLNGSFQDDASCEPVSDKAHLLELTERTPGYSGWQQEQWLSHCDDFCAFKGYVGWKEITPLKVQLHDDIERICYDFHMPVDTLAVRLVNGGSMQGYLFQCIHCGHYRLTADLD